MTGDGVERRLAAIMSADVAGYSRLMGKDEAGTLAALKALRREVFAPQVAAHAFGWEPSTASEAVKTLTRRVDATRPAPLALELWYDFHEVGCHLGNVG